MRLTIFFLFVLINASANSQDYSKYRIPKEKVIYPIHYYHVLAPPFLLENRRDTSSLNIIDLISQLNFMFVKTNIEFKLCQHDTIYDYNYNSQEDDIFNEDHDLTRMHYDNYAINVYRVIDTLKESFYGLCWPKSARPCILVPYADNPTITMNSVVLFARQMFRYFGLNYTGSTNLSKELVNTTNTFVTADSIWDTPADPFHLAPSSSPDTLLYQGSNPPLLYFYSNRKDANGAYYDPMALNIMSINLISPAKRCLDLTHQQYQHIIATERRCRKRFWELE